MSVKKEQSHKPEDKAKQKRAPRDPQGRKQAIIDAAADLISREGSNKVTNRRVAELANVPLGSTTQYFKSIDELRRAGLAELAKRIEEEYDKAFLLVKKGSSDAGLFADYLIEYLSDQQRVYADAVMYAAAIEDPEVRGITRATYELFIKQCKPFMDEQRARILWAFMEGAIIDSCFMGVPFDQEMIRKAVSLILEES